MAVWWQGVAEDFSDLPSASQTLRIVVRLVMAAALGGLLGYERGRVGKAAGLRTHMLVALGAAFFVLVPQQVGFTSEGMSRVIQGIVVGIGFLGAGTILKLSEQGRVKGLTTAAGVWLTAAVGIAAGMGREVSAILVTALALVILSVLSRVEQYLVVRAKLPDRESRPQAPGDGSSAASGRGEE